MTLMATDKMKAETTMGKLDFNNKQKNGIKKKKKTGKKFLCTRDRVKAPATFVRLSGLCQILIA